MDSTVVNIATLVSRYVVTPWLTIKHAITGTVKLFIPTHISKVVHINPHNDTITLIHDKPFWAHNPCHVMRLSQKERDHGMYYIQTWDGVMKESKTYYLNAKCLREALGLTTLAHWWAMHDYGIQVLLNAYMAFQNNPVGSNSIFAVYDDQETDYSHQVHTITKSLQLKNNVTAHGLTLLLKHLGHIDETSQHYICNIVDFDLNERKIDRDDYISV